MAPDADRPLRRSAATTRSSSIDREALAERFEVVDYFQPGPLPRPLELWRKVRDCDVVFAWFATWHTLAALPREAAPQALGRRHRRLRHGERARDRLRRAAGGVRRWMARWIAHRATRLVTNSDYLVGEIEENLGIPARPTCASSTTACATASRASTSPREREPTALTVGVVYRLNNERKGHRPFVLAARELPDVEFTLAGDWLDDAVEGLRAEAPENVEFTGYLSDPELDDALPALGGLRPGLAPRGVRPLARRGDARRRGPGRDPGGRAARGRRRRRRDDRRADAARDRGGRAPRARARAARRAPARASACSSTSPTRRAATGSAPRWRRRCATRPLPA